MSVRLHHVKHIEYGDEYFGNVYNLPQSLLDLFNNDISEYEITMDTEDLRKWLEENKNNNLGHEFYRSLQSALSWADACENDTITFHNY